MIASLVWSAAEPCINLFKALYVPALLILSLPYFATAFSKVSLVHSPQSLGSHISNLHFLPSLVLITPSLSAFFIQRSDNNLTKGTLRLYFAIILSPSSRSNPKELANLFLPIP